MTKKIGAVVFALFFIYMFFAHRKDRAQKKAFDFCGKIDKITYDVKKILITVQGKSFYLSPIREFGKEVEVGDSVIKLRGEFKMKVIKQNHKVIEFEL